MGCHFISVTEAKVGKPDNVLLVTVDRRATQQHVKMSKQTLFDPQIPAVGTEPK